MSRILILDDDPSRHSVFSRCFPSHELTHAHTAQSAIYALRAVRYDLVCFGDAGSLDELFAVPTHIACHMQPDERPKRALVHASQSGVSWLMGAVLSDAGVLTIRHPFSALWTARHLSCLLVEEETR